MDNYSLEDIRKILEGDTRLSTSFGLAMNNKPLWDYINTNNLTKKILVFLEPDIVDHHEYHAMDSLSSIIPKAWTIKQQLRFIRKYKFRTKKEFRRRYQSVGPHIDARLFKIDNPPPSKRELDNIFKNIGSVNDHISNYIKDNNLTRNKLFDDFFSEETCWETNWIISKMGEKNFYTERANLDADKKVLWVSNSEIERIIISNEITTHNISKYPYIKETVELRGIPPKVPEYEYTSIFWSKPLVEADVFEWSYERSKNYVQKLGFNNAIEFFEWRKTPNRPRLCPSNPNIAYKDRGWVDWGEYLGTGRNKDRSRFVTFQEFCHEVRRAGIRSETMFREWDRPDGIPGNPPVFYESEWVDWYHALDKERPRLLEETPIEKCTEYLEDLAIFSSGDWRKYCESGERPDWIPSDPRNVYRDKGWTNWEDFLGVNSPKKPLNKMQKKFLRCIEYLKDVQVYNKKEYRKWSESGHRPSWMPTQPSRSFKKYGWLNWKHFLSVDDPAKISKMENKKAA